jgi:hypothetical protein
VSKLPEIRSIRASLETLIFQGNFIFQKKINSFFYRKIEILWKIKVLKLALIEKKPHVRWDESDMGLAWDESRMNFTGYYCKSIVFRGLDFLEG